MTRGVASGAAPKAASPPLDRLIDLAADLAAAEALGVQVGVQEPGVTRCRQRVEVAGRPWATMSWMSLALKPPFTTPRVSGRAGGPTGPPRLLHSHTATAPLTPLWAKWMCSLGPAVALVRAQEVSVKVLCAALSSSQRMISSD